MIISVLTRPDARSLSMICWIKFLLSRLAGVVNSGEVTGASNRLMLNSGLHAFETNKIPDSVRFMKKIHARTERLLLRDWDSQDLDAYAAIIADPLVMEHIGNGKPRPRSQAEDFIRTVMAHQQSRGWTRFAVEHAASGQLMGFCGVDDKTGHFDFGWRYARSFWGAGFGFEAASAALWVCQNTFSLTHIISQSYPENEGSIRIMQKMGMVQIGEGTDFGLPLVIYGFASEWPDGFI